MGEPVGQPVSEPIGLPGSFSSSTTTSSTTEAAPAAAPATTNFPIGFAGGTIPAFGSAPSASASLGALVDVFQRQSAQAFLGGTGFGLAPLRSTSARPSARPRVSMLEAYQAYAALSASLAQRGITTPIPARFRWDILAAASRFALPLRSSARVNPSDPRITSSVEFLRNTRFGLARRRPPGT